MGVVRYIDVSHTYPGAKEESVSRLTLDVADGEFLTVVGPSGSGKSTALRLLAGLETASGGEIWIGEEEVSGAAPKDRDIAMVFQTFALYPHMTVEENMGFALKMQKLSKPDIKERVARAAAVLDLTEVLSRRPKALSGGQRQRVAMGRAIVREPAVFLMDEPLSNLDQKLRLATRTNIAALQQRLETTTVYVTHDQVEAMTLGHRVAVLDKGVLQQVATPRDLYDRPESVFVAGFIGSPGMNLIEAPIVDGAVHLGELEVPVPRSARDALDDAEIVLGVRPEGIQVLSQGTPMKVQMAEELGADAFIHGTVPVGGVEHPIIVRSPGRIPPSIGSTIRLDIVDDNDVHFFHPRTGRRL